MSFEKLGPFALFGLDPENFEVNLRKDTWEFKYGDNTLSGKLSTDMSKIKGDMFDMVKTFTVPSPTRNEKPSKIGWAYPNPVQLEFHNISSISGGPLPKFGSQAVDRFLRTGGFVLLNRKNKVLKILEIAPLESVNSSDSTMSFENPFEVSEKDWNRHCKQSNQVTIPALIEAGVERYCWATKGKQCKEGCFWYKSATTIGYHGFAIFHQVKADKRAEQVAKQVAKDKKKEAKKAKKACRKACKNKARRARKECRKKC